MIERYILILFKNIYTTVAYSTCVTVVFQTAVCVNFFVEVELSFFTLG